MSQEILRLPDVKRRTGLSRASIYAYIKSKNFPAPILIGLRSVGWPADQVDEWVKNRPATPNIRIPVLK